MQSPPNPSLLKIPVNVEAPMTLSALLLAGIGMLPGELFRSFVGVHGMLMRLFGEFMGGEMVTFAVGGSRSRVRVGGKIVELCNSIVWCLRHDVLLKLRCVLTGKNSWGP